MRVTREPDDIRPVRITSNYLDFAEGSAFIEIGRNKIIAAATIEDKVPHFLKGSGQGWITSEYSLLPRSTDRRNNRERNHGRISGRSHEIQRLIGRALRTVVDMDILGEKTIIIDCDVLQADGGTRTASITAGCIAMALAMRKLMSNGQIDKMPLKNLVAAVSVGIVDGQHLLDLDYDEDSNAEVDMNVVKTDTGQYIEIQATAEKKAISKKEFDSLLALADKGIDELIRIQKDILKEESMLFMAYGNQDPGSE